MLKRQTFNGPPRCLQGASKEKKEEKELGQLQAGNEPFRGVSKAIKGLSKTTTTTTTTTYYYDYYNNYYYYDYY